MDGFDSIPGMGGIDGSNGVHGIPGTHGAHGKEGGAGLSGIKGMPGGRGGRGSPGNSAVSGDTGDYGPIGMKGTSGDEGREGSCSETCIAQDDPVERGSCLCDTHVLAVHSRSNEVPDCPDHWRSLWSGYSFILLYENGVNMLQDPGSPGSCMETFSPAPFMTCEKGTQCGQSYRSEKSVWLATNSSVPLELMKNEEETVKYVSRCNVCIGPSMVQAVHSFSDEVPRCPDTFLPLWTGYSYLMSLHDDLNLSPESSKRSGKGIPTNSPGSCSREFQSPSFMECMGAGYCSHYKSHGDYWLTTGENETGSIPGRSNMVHFYDSNTLQYTGQRRGGVSRCAVCSQIPRHA